MYHCKLFYCVEIFWKKVFGGFKSQIFVHRIFFYYFEFNFLFIFLNGVNKKENYIFNALIDNISC